jgi:hypothetical protein
MKEKPAKDTKGYIMYNPFKDKYFFRIYQGSGNFIDYDINIEELEVKISSKYASFYEEKDYKKLDWSSEALGKKKQK